MQQTQKEKEQIETWKIEADKRDLRVKRRRNRNKRAIMAGMKKIGAVTAYGSYSGAGDDGSIEGIQIYNGKHKEISRKTRVLYTTEHACWTGKDHKYRTRESTEMMDLGDAIVQFMEDYIEHNYSGCYDNEGGGGSVLFSMKSGTVKWDHYWNTTESEGEKLL